MKETPLYVIEAWFGAPADGAWGPLPLTPHGVGVSLDKHAVEKLRVKLNQVMAGGRKFRIAVYARKEEPDAGSKHCASGA